MALVLGVSFGTAADNLAPRETAAGRCKPIDTETSIGMANGRVSLAFDTGNGSLVSLKNLATGDQYLKERDLKERGGSGNLLRLYLEPTELPGMVTATFPWRVGVPDDSDTFGGEVLDTSDCKLASHAFEHVDGVGVLRLVLRSAEAELALELEVRLADYDDAVDCLLVVRNEGRKARRLLTAFPYLRGLGLGADRGTNLAVKMKKHGIAGEPAWDDPTDGKYSNGGVYGKHFIMQWQAVYEPTLNEGLGLIVMDAELRNKLIHRFPGGGMSVLFFPEDQIPPGESLAYPPVRLTVHQGGWREVARRYGRWFNRSFPRRLPPPWYDRLDLWGSAHFPSPE